MNYSEMTKLYANKFKTATLEQCNFAIRDIDQTLALYQRGVGDPYVEKLLCERDAAIDRKMTLQKEATKEPVFTKVKCGSRIYYLNQETFSFYCDSKVERFVEMNDLRRVSLSYYVIEDNKLIKARGSMESLIDAYITTL